jgi:predicted small lipoprotein YifL
MPAVIRRAARSAFACSLVLASVAGCGAKTGLDVPDAARDAGRDSGTDAGMDAGVPPICIEVPPMGGPVAAELTIPAFLQIVDVMFVIDASASMRDEINTVRDRLGNLVVPGIRAAIPDAAFGIAFLGEFPVLPHARPDSGVRPYELRSPITTDVDRIDAALVGVPTWGNLDDPEADIEALFQVATGRGLPPFIEASFGCPGGGVGAACFRDEAFRVIMLATDAPMHNGPPGVAPVANYTAVVPSPHSYGETVTALSDIDVTLIGLGATDEGRPSPLPHLGALARDLGSVDGAGRPLVFDIGSSGDRIGDEIVSAVERLARGVPLDVSAAVEDAPGDAIDARTLVRSVEAVSADPPSGVAGIAGDEFTGVVPGTRLTFQITIDASSLPASHVRREIPAHVVFRESRRSRIHTDDILIVIPGDDGAGCP